MESPFSLKDKLILVTGASSGIGRHIAIVLSKAGAKLVITGRDNARLEETFSQLNGAEHEKITCDLTSAQDRDILISQLSKLNGVVHTAGVLEIKPVKFIDEDDLQNINSVNYSAPVLLSQALLENKLLLPKSSIVFITSIAANIGAVGFGIYSGSKGALTSFARVLALETAPQKIRVNCIAPGMVKTPMFDITTDSLSEEALSENEKLYPLGFVTPSDVANGVLFLLADASEKVTGITLTIDGGLSIS